ncbi:hypothetical protein D3C75_908190 [compost metagenome]
MAITEYRLVVERSLPHLHPGYSLEHRSIISSPWRLRLNKLRPLPGGDGFQHAISMLTQIRDEFKLRQQTASKLLRLRREPQQLIVSAALKRVNGIGGYSIIPEQMQRLPVICPVSQQHFRQIFIIEQIF